jgi:hypothetical protein
MFLYAYQTRALNLFCFALTLRTSCFALTITSAGRKVVQPNPLAMVNTYYYNSMIQKNTSSICSAANLSVLKLKLIEEGKGQ